MQKKISLKYGKTGFPVELPDKAQTLSIREPVSDISRETFLNDFSKALPKDLSTHAAIAIVVADKTRLCGYTEYLPWILDILHNKNITSSQIQFFIAYGTHARQKDEECLNVYGKAYETYRFIHHDCKDESLFTPLGQTRSGTRIRIRKDLLESDLIITFGALSHHYFAGYGGGRKLLFPGLGYRPDIYQNHELFLDKRLKKLNGDCRPGNLENNSLARDLKEIDDHNETQRVSIHGILDSTGRVCQLCVGKTYDDFLSACQTLDSFYKDQTQQQYDLVLASCGGFPKDINFIQAHKAIHNAAMFVKDQGSLIVLAECADGIGSDAFIEYFNYNGFNAAFDVLEKEYKGNGGTALSMMSKTNRIHIFLKTALDDKICRTIKVKKIEDNMIHKQIKEFQHDMACIENASLLIR